MDSSEKGRMPQLNLAYQGGFHYVTKIAPSLSVNMEFEVCVLAQVVT